MHNLQVSLGNMLEQYYSSSCTVNDSGASSPYPVTPTTGLSAQSNDHVAVDKGDPQAGSSVKAYLVEGCEGPYQDYLSVPMHTIKSQLDTPESKRKGPRGGVSQPFPLKLYDMLTGVEKERLEHIVSWTKHGRCFQIHDAQAFVDEIMPRYFKQSKLTSFQRQLNLYGFQRVTCHRDRGGYFHPLFLRGRPDVCKVLLRQRIKGGATLKLSATAATRTNFYELPHCPEAPAGHFALISGGSGEQQVNNDACVRKSDSDNRFGSGVSGQRLHNTLTYPSEEVQSHQADFFTRRPQETHEKFEHSFSHSYIEPLATTAQNLESCGRRTLIKHRNAEKNNNYILQPEYSSSCKHDSFFESLAPNKIFFESHPHPQPLSQLSFQNTYNDDLMGSFAGRTFQVVSSDPVDSFEAPAIGV